MKKSIFKRLVARINSRVKHGGKGFKKLIDNPAGSKFRKHSRSDSRRGCDGTMR